MEPRDGQYFIWIKKSLAKNELKAAVNLISIFNIFYNNIKGIKSTEAVIQ